MGRRLHRRRREHSTAVQRVLLHQTVIGQEAMEQMAMAGEQPDLLIGCTGGGSNFTQGEFNTQPPVRYYTVRLDLSF